MEFLRKAALCLAGTLALGGAAPGTLPLAQGWAIQAASRAPGADAVSTPGFETKGWTRAQVPSTVLGTLVDEGVYPDPFRGRNLEEVPSAPFQEPWWYRTEFRVGRGEAALHTRLQLDGVNYRAEVWLNGRKVAGGDAVYGAFRTFDLDLTPWLREGANALALKVSPPAKDDFTVGFVDWNPSAPDRNMGVFREARLRRSGPVSVENVFVRSKVDLGTLKEASLTVGAELVNHEARTVSGTLKGEIGALKFEAPYALAPGERRPVTFDAAAFPVLRIRNPRLWWPLNLGEPALYTLRLRALMGATASDAVSTDFGIRQVSSGLDAEGRRYYSVNGRRVLVRGGGWVDDLFLREPSGNLEAQFRHIRNMNLNTIRLEGFWGSSRRLYDLADRNGILVMVGITCHWEWQEYVGLPDGEDERYGAARTPAQIDLVAAYLRDQVRWLRNHPSILTWVLGSDKMPYPEAEKRYQADLEALDPTRPRLISTKTWTSTLSGPSGVKMLGPYDYVPPIYWYQDTQLGGAYGFNTETGPGPQVPPLASLKRMFPEKDLWPRDKADWEFHCGRHEFGKLDTYQSAFERRYGPCASIEEYALRAQAMNYEAVRAMYEAFGVRQPRATGVVQWMLNAAWPKLYWQLYDWYLRPNGAYYGARKGCQPLNVAYDYSRNTVHVVNDTREPLRDAQVRVRVFDAASKAVFDRTVTVSCPPGASVQVLDLKASPAPGLRFLDLSLRGKGVEAGNFYWLSAAPDVLDYGKSSWFCTPIQTPADFTGLAALPKAELRVQEDFSKAGEGVVTLANPTDRIAFMVELGLQPAGAGEPIAAAVWDDNYLSIPPHETRTVRVRFQTGDLQGRRPHVVLQGWNVPAQP